MECLFRKVKKGFGITSPWKRSDRKFLIRKLWIICGFLWFIYVFSMVYLVYLWFMCGLSIDYLWFIYSLFMVHLWFIYGLSVVYL